MSKLAEISGGCSLHHTEYALKKSCNLTSDFLFFQNALLTLYRPAKTTCKTVETNELFRRRVAISQELHHDRYKPSRRYILFIAVYSVCVQRKKRKKTKEKGSNINI